VGQQSKPLDSPSTPTNWEDYDNLGLTPTAPNNILESVNERSNLIEVVGLPWELSVDRIDSVSIMLDHGSDGRPLRADDYVGAEAPTGLRMIEKIDEIAQFASPTMYILHVDGGQVANRAGIDRPR
jgi:hypothetical protein